LTYVNETYGTRVTNLAIDGRFSASELRINRFTGRAGNGTVNGSGTIGLSSAAGYPIDLRVEFQNARLARSDDLRATATGNLRITNNHEGAWIRGALDLGEVRYQIVQQAAAEIPQLAGVRRRGEPLPAECAARRRAGAEHLAARHRASRQQPHLRLRHGHGIRMADGQFARPGHDDDARAGRPGADDPRHIGPCRPPLPLRSRRGEFRRGAAAAARSRPTADIESVEVGIVIAGNSANPQISFTSSPSLPQDEVVSRILFGSSVTQISALQAVQLAASLNSLRPSAGGGLNPLGRLRSATGIDRLRIIDADTATGHGTAVAAGMYLSDNIYVEIITDAKGYTATQIEISLTRALSLLSQFGSNSGTNVNLRYNRDY
jgi:translocation and assembly module TamB